MLSNQNQIPNQHIINDWTIFIMDYGGMMERHGISVIRR
jgi:hypothetical protein